jgi:hypothetical protein
VEDEDNDDSLLVERGPDPGGEGVIRHSLRMKDACSEESITEISPVRVANVVELVHVGMVGIRNIDLVAFRELVDVGAIDVRDHAVVFLSEQLHDDWPMTERSETTYPLNPHVRDEIRTFE